MFFTIVIAIVIGYLLGAIPFAYIIARRMGGIDIRQTGSGNIGTLNAYREAGPVYGMIVFVADVAKGVLAVLIAGWLGLTLEWICAAGFAAVVGHNWPCFMKFRGGKGAATIMGTLLPLIPAQFAIGFGIAVIVIVITSNVPLGIVGIAFMPLIAWLFHEPLILIIYSLALFLFLATVSITGLSRAMIKTGDKKSLIFNKEYHFWQTKKKK